MESGKQIAIVGGGSWATALVKILSNNCDRIHWWMRSHEAVQSIQQNKHNPSYLSDVEIDLNKVVPTSDLKSTIDQCDLIILAVPSAFLESSLSEIPPARHRARTAFDCGRILTPSFRNTIRTDRCDYRSMPR
jgi:glycerol-3-phosphate dehydrogenase (NAD(P)+)